MALHQLRQEFFMDRALAPLERRDFVFVIIDEENLMA